MRVVSVNAGRAEPMKVGARTVLTGIRKAPVGRGYAGTLGLAGDVVADEENHGRLDQALGGETHPRLVELMDVWYDREAAPERLERLLAAPLASGRAGISRRASNVPASRKVLDDRGIERGGRVAHDADMNIVIRHDDAGRWWWTALDESGAEVAVSVPHASRADCVRAIAELKVEGPPARVSDDDGYAARPGTWTISSLIPSGS